VAVFGWPPSEFDRLTEEELKTWAVVAKRMAKARRGGK
jgi:hypothetical protein